MSDKLSINNEMKAFDQKDRAFYDDLTDEEKKKFSTYLMLRYGSCVEGSSDMQEWYLRATNELVNVNFFDLGTKHTKLQWLACTTVSPGLGNQRHYWLAPKKKDSSNNKLVKFLADFYPNLSQDELELLARINSEEDIKRMAREHGLADKDIKSRL